MGWPFTTSPTKVVPAGLTLKPPIEAWLVVLTALTRVALTRPLSKLTLCVAAVPVAETPVAVALDDAVVLIVPVASTGGTVTDRAVFVLLRPTFELQPVPMPTGAEGPDLTTLPVTWVP